MTESSYTKILIAPSPPNPTRRTINQNSDPNTNNQQSQEEEEEEEENNSLGNFKRKKYNQTNSKMDLSVNNNNNNPICSNKNEKTSSNSFLVNNNHDLNQSSSKEITSGSSSSSINNDGDQDEECDELESKEEDGLTNYVQNYQKQQKPQKPQPEEEQDDEEEEEDSGEESTMMKYSLHIEVRLRSNATILYHTVRNDIENYIHDNFTTLETQAPVPGWQDLKFLVDQVYSVYCCESSYPISLVPINLTNLNIHVYELPVEGEDKITMLSANLNPNQNNNLDSSEFDHDHDHDNNGGNVNEDDQSGQDGVDVAACKIQLPANRLEGIWENLVYEDGLKIKLLNYIYSSILFAEQNVNQNVIAWHRLVLLHGPPGTGKTSLCKSLGQKISIRLSGIYQKTELVEINSHSLFSKWFSESGKLVNSLFNKIEFIAQDSDVFVLVLIDEVESLAGCRSSGASGGEPSDALRAVNSLLTALDKLRNYKNVLVLTTSNLTGSIDEAFLDRADIKQFIPLPSSEAIYWILHTCLIELMNTNILSFRKFLDFKEAVMAREELGEQSSSSGGKVKHSKSVKSSLKLLEISEAARGLSGRSLRRLPLLAHASSSSSSSRTSMSGMNKKLQLDYYLSCMLATLVDTKL